MAAPNSYISSLLPPGVDPASVDFRTFYPYIPNEVKHRKRTSRTQLKVLENIFRTDTKPSATIRNALATQLQMSPRGVQVWFQNRRAKEKALAKKARDGKNKSISVPKLTSVSDSPSSSTDTLPSPVDPAEDDDDDSLRQQLHATPLGLGLSRMSWRSAHNLGPDDASVPEDELSVVSLARRGSMPNVPLPLPSPDPSSHPTTSDPLARRSSMDHTRSRLAAHPYAHLAVAANTTLYGRRSSGSFLHPHQHPYTSAFGPGRARRPSPHRSELIHQAAPPSSTSTNSAPSSGHPTPNIPRSRLPDPRLYEYTTRAVVAPIPGPLPAPDFSFGTPTSSATSPHPASTHSHPQSPHPNTDLGEQLHAFSFPPRPVGTSGKVEDFDADVDDATSASFISSRFGSIGSLAGSESSATSAGFYSEECDPNNANYDPEVRRPSFASSQFPELFSSLQVTTNPPLGKSRLGSHSHTRLISQQDVYSSQEDLNMDDAGSSSQHLDGSNIGTLAYPSPSSTLSGGSDHHTLDGGHGHGQGSSRAPVMRISHESELSYALDDSDGRHYGSHHNHSHSPEPGLIFASTSHQHHHQHHSHHHPHHPHSHSLRLDVDLDVDKFLFEPDGADGLGVSSTGHYSPASYHAPPLDFGGQGQELLQLHHAMEYGHGPTGDAFPGLGGVVGNVGDVVGAPVVGLRYANPLEMAPHGPGVPSADAYMYYS